MSDTARSPEKYVHESNRWQQTLCTWTHFFKKKNNAWKHWTNEDRTIRNQLRSPDICVWLARCFKILWMYPVEPRGPGRLTGCPSGGTNWRRFTRHKRGNENERGWEERGQDSIKDERTASERSSHRTLFKCLGCSPPLPQRHCVFQICVCVCVPARSSWCWV